MKCKQTLKKENVQKGLKLVNRMEFSRLNFTAEKDWDQ